MKKNIIRNQSQRSRDYIKVHIGLIKIFKLFN
jgi:hypothetical protein